MCHALCRIIVLFNACNSVYFIPFVRVYTFLDTFTPLTVQGCGRALQNGGRIVCTEIGLKI